MEIEPNEDLKFNFFCSNNLNNFRNTTNDLTSENELLLSTEEKSYLPFPSTQISCENALSNFDNRNNLPKFNYKKLLNVKKSTTIISSSEARLMKDLEELKKNKDIGKHCEVIINDYKRIKDTDNFQLIVEFKNFFSVQFVFCPDYPFSPPIISYYSGMKPSQIFDENGYILLENAKKTKWTPTLYVSHFIISIEILISKELDNKIENPNLSKYCKRKWNDYLRDEHKIFNNDESIFNELSSKIKKIKYYK